MHNKSEVEVCRSFIWSF